MYQPPPPHQPPPYPPPPPPRRGFLQFGVGGAIVVIAISTLGTFARIHNRNQPKYEAKENAEGSGLPMPGSEGTLANGGAKTALCPVPQNAAFFGWPCKAEKKLPAESKVRVMKAGFHQGAKCRYWVQSGPLDNEAGDAPCEWFVAQ